MQNKLYIVFGFLFLYLINLVLISLFLFTYLKARKLYPKYEGKVFIISTMAAFLCLIANSISLIFFSNHPVLFGISSFVLLFGATLLTLYKQNKFTRNDSIIIAVAVGILINPIWPTILGVM